MAIYLKDILEGLLEKDLLDIYVWLNWYSRKGRIECNNCIQTKVEQSGNPPNCFKCANPTIRNLNKYFDVKIERRLTKEEKQKINSMIGEEIIVEK